MLKKIFTWFTLCLAGMAAQAAKAPAMNDKAVVKAARELITRVTPGYEKQYVLEVIPTDAQSGEDVFEVDARKGKVVLRGNNPVALASAFHWYLKYTCKAQLSWFGDQLNLPERLPLPAAKERRTIGGKYRAYFNYCTLSYTAPWWDWERWQREIDFMAMNGINMPLQPIGLDAVWYETLLRMGFTDLEARTFLVGPGHQAWQWMTNIEQFGGPLPKSWIDSHVELGRRIFARQLELGMKPIQQSFTGYVPKLMAEKYPEAKIAQQPEWYGFEGVSQLDPLDPLFDRMGHTFMQVQDSIFGSYGIYSADPFHESAPPVNTPEYLSAVGKKISNLIDDFDPRGIVAMQAWSIREPIATQFPKDRLVVLDLNGSTYPNKKNFGGIRSWRGTCTISVAVSTCTATWPCWPRTNTRRLGRRPRMRSVRACSWSRSSRIRSIMRWRSKCRCTGTQFALLNGSMLIRCGLTAQSRMRLSRRGLSC